MRTPGGDRILAGGAVLAVVVLAGLAWLVVQALHGAAAAEAERHRQLADRLFDELERELSALVTREEGRSFLEYRFFYVPEDNALGNASAAVVQSPLSRPPDDPAIVGWFQLDPDGTLHSPSEPRPNEEDLARAQGWVAPADDREELVDAVRSVNAWSAGAPAPIVADGDLLLNRGAQQRAGRQVQKVTTKGTNVEPYCNDATGSAVDPRDVDVDVTPMGGVRVGDHLVLSRVVRTEGAEFRQGLVLRVPELERGLEEAVLAGSPVGDAVALTWDAVPATTRAWRATHRFAEPFGGLSVTADLDRIPALVGHEATTVRLLAAGLGLAVLGGGLLLGRAVWTELEFARRRGDFVAAVSHELKTPLTTIRMYAEMLRDGMVGPDRQREYHATITAEADRLGRLIGNVLELARLERGAPGPAPVARAVEPVVRDALEVVRPHAERAAFRVELAVEPGLPPALVDRDALVQVVVNLCDNAVKFAADGERSIRVELGRTPDGRVRLSVRDHGPGVPFGQQGRIFEPFWRGERELTRETRGTGIGLALVRGLTERMGGEVTARNHPEGGFEVMLVLAGPRSRVPE